MFIMFPRLQLILLSVSQLCNDNFVSIEFFSNCYCIKDLYTKKILHQGSLDHGLCTIQAAKQLQQSKTCFSAYHTVPITAHFMFHSFLRFRTVPQQPAAIWHARLGHAHANVVNHVLNKCNKSFSYNKLHVCSSFQYAKNHRLPFNNSSSHTTQALALVHTDIWGPSPIPSTDGSRYFLLFVDDHTRFTWLYALSHKSQALSVFQQFKTLVENQFSTEIKILQSHNGVSLRLSFHFLLLVALLINSLVLTHLLKMVELSVNIYMLLKHVYLC